MLQDRTKSIVTVEKLTGEELASKLNLKRGWRTLYKKMHSDGHEYESSQEIPFDLEAQYTQHYATARANRPVAITNAARRHAQQRGITLEDYTIFPEEGGEARPSPQPNKGNRRKPNKPGRRNPRRPQPKPDPQPQAAAQPVARKWDFFTALLLLSALVFIGFDGFSAGFIVLKTYSGAETMPQMIEAMENLGGNKVALVGSAIGALVGIAIGFIAIGSVVYYKGKEEYENLLKGVFAVFQFVLHFVAMPKQDIGMLVLAAGLMLGTLGNTIALRNKINPRS